MSFDWLANSRSWVRQWARGRGVAGGEMDEILSDQRSVAKRRKKREEESPIC
jgi:hypothetical protein